MNRSRSLSAHSPNFALRRTIGVTIAAVLALIAMYGGFFAVCAVMVATGLAA
ncbi:hypothetical protein [Williamsia sp.]|uniref:hypothetical protein n=1 Tax=Williamsia sp. TaxID=1872085 RepID=UPI002F91CA48